VSVEHVERGPLYAFTMPGLYAVGVAGVALGIARAMLEGFIGLACRKVPRGLTRLADNGFVQAELAWAEAKLGGARAYLLETPKFAERLRLNASLIGKRRAGCGGAQVGGPR
jgi:alkylation response protein AidB-like acyl-CoA dehydrogenase